MPMHDASGDPAATVSVFDRIPTLVSLRYPAYRLLTAGVAPHLISMQMSSVATGYLAYSLTGEATILGLIGLGWGIPMLSLSLVGGVVADRFPRRTILLGTQSLVGLAATLGAVLLLTNLIQVWHIFLIALLQGIAFAFNMPARQALIGELVQPTHLGNAVAVNNSMMNFSRVVGPPIAGFLIATPAIGISGVFVLMASLYLIVLLTLWRLPRMPAIARRSQGGWRAMVDGLAFIRSSPLLVGLLALAFAPMFFGMPHQTLLPVFAIGVLDAGPAGLGLLTMASGIGALAGSVGVTLLAAGAHQRQAQTVLGLLFGASLIGFAYSPTLVLAAVMVGLVGVASAGYMSINNALIMNATPRQFHGRVMSVYMMTWSLMPLASLPAARLADAVGPAITVGGMGLLLMVCIVAIMLWLRRVPAMTETAERVEATGPGSAAAD